MKFNKNIYDNSGIYLILNTHSKRFYIGQTKNFTRRWNQHKNLLLKEAHRNQFIQNDYNKCKLELGHDDFLEFLVLKNMINSSIKDRNKLEEHFLDLYFDNQNKCYNIEKKSYNIDRVFSHNPEETRNKQKLIGKKRCQNPKEREKMKCLAEKNWQNPEFVEKMNAIRQNQAYKQNQTLLAKKQIEQNPDRLAKMLTARIALVKPTILINPEGNEVIIPNLSVWCKEKGFKSSSFYALKSGKGESIHGYTLPKT